MLLRKDNTYSPEFQPTLYVQSQTPSASDAVEGAQYESDGDGRRHVPPPPTALEDTSNNDIIEISSASSPGEEEKEDNEGGDMKDKDYKAPRMEYIEPDESEAFWPEDNGHVNGFENTLLSLRKKGGSSRLREDVAEEQEVLGIQAKNDCFKDVILDEL